MSPVSRGRPFTDHDVLAYALDVRSAFAGTTVGRLPRRRSSVLEQAKRAMGPDGDRLVKNEELRTLADRNAVARARAGMDAADPRDH